jgi:hypothetical protein
MLKIGQFLEYDRGFAQRERLRRELELAQSGVVREAVLLEAEDRKGLERLIADISKRRPKSWNPKSNFPNCRESFSPFPEVLKYYASALAALNYRFSIAISAMV